MLFIGLLIALAAAVFAAVVLAEDWGGATYAIHGFGHVLGNLTLAGVFLSGIIITAIFFFALWMASVSSMMRRRSSRRRRAETRAVREEHEGLVGERDRLARELDAERAARGTDHQALADRQANVGQAGYATGQPGYAAGQPGDAGQGYAGQPGYTAGQSGYTAGQPGYAGAYPDQPPPYADRPGVGAPERQSIDLDERERLAAYDRAANDRRAADEETRRHTV